MEEILASIRRIITDDEAGQAQAQEATPTAQAEDESLEGEADNQIIDDIARVLSGDADKAPATEEEEILDLAAELGGLEIVEEGSGTAVEVTEVFEPDEVVSETPGESRAEQPQAEQPEGAGCLLDSLVDPQTTRAAAPGGTQPSANLVEWESHKRCLVQIVQDLTQQSLPGYDHIAKASNGNLFLGIRINDTGPAFGKTKTLSIMAIRNSQNYRQIIKSPINAFIFYGRMA